MSSNAPNTPRSLPVWQVRDPILNALEHQRCLVLVAPTGSGKTTQVPQMILESGLAGPGQIVVLQPRRVAARSVATRVAYERACRLGGEVGYQIRFDDATSIGTRISYVTEGILLRWIERDPLLRGVTVVVFDEFHERNLMSDVGLALVRQVQLRARPDLRLAVMSATLDADPVARYLDDCPIVHSEGRQFPVDVKYEPVLTRADPWDLAGEAVGRILRSGEPGDILVFMPGMHEILRTLDAIRAHRTDERLLLLPLHGDLAPEDQDRVFQPAEVRKVIVATNVAETSITIDGVLFVVDSGLARVARYDAERGLTSLMLEPISRASAEQRRGRAGRTAPGTCLRLWTESGHLNRAEKNTPEIQRSDLAEVVLLLHSLGVSRADSFPWLDAPDKQAVARAEKLLETLGALAAEPAPDPAATPSSSPALRLTPVGRRMLKLPMHPRFSRMLLEAERHACVPAALLCAALVGGRDMMVRPGREDRSLAEAQENLEVSRDSDFFTLMRAFEVAARSGFSVDACRRYGIRADIARQVAQTFDQLQGIARDQGLLPRERAGEPAPPPGTDQGLLRSICAGFIDQLAVRRDQGTLDCDMPCGSPGTLVRSSVVHDSKLLVVGSVREIQDRSGKPMTLLSLASAVKPAWILEDFPHLVSTTLEHQYDRGLKRVSALKCTRFMGFPIEANHSKDLDPVASGRCLAEAHRRGDFELPLFHHDLKQWVARANLIALAMPELEVPLMDEQRILDGLTAAFRGLTLAKEAQATAVERSVKEALGRGRDAWIDEMAPVRIPWHDGKNLKLTYVAVANPALDRPVVPDLCPELQVKLHDCFPLTSHPCIAEGKIPVRLWLATPDGKRLESTTHWLEFKQRHYPKLKPTLMKKHPGVPWI